MATNSEDKRTTLDGYEFTVKLMSNIHKQGYIYKMKSPCELFKTANEMLNNYHWKVNETKMDGFALMRLTLLSIRISHEFYQLFGTSFESYESFIRGDEAIELFDSLKFGYEFKYQLAYRNTCKKHQDMVDNKPGKAKYHTSALELMKAIEDLHMCQLRYNDFTTILNDFHRIDKYVGSVNISMIAYRNKLTADLKESNERFKAAMDKFNTDHPYHNNGIVRSIITEALSYTTMDAIPSDVFRSFYMPNNRTMFNMYVIMPEVDDEIYLPHDRHSEGATRLNPMSPSCAHSTSCHWFEV